MCFGYSPDPADNLPERGAYSGAFDGGAVCPVCGRRYSFLYLFSPDGCPRTRRSASARASVVGCDRCIFVSDA